MKSSAQKTRLFLAGLISCWLALSVRGAETVETKAGGIETNTPATEAKPQEAVSTEEVMRAFLHVQEELRAAQLAIEQGRNEAEAAATRNAQAWSNRLEIIEQSLYAQRERELETMQRANRTMLIAAGSFAGLGFLAMMITSLLQWRAANRLSEMAASSHMTRALLPPGWTMPALAGGDGRLTGEPAAVSARLFDAIGHLEKLVLALEHTATPPLSDAPGGEQQISSPGKTNAATAPGDAVPTDTAARITLLLGKGQSLLNLNQPEDAESCFDEVLGLDGNNTEALLKKGVALERQRKLNEAIECYDRAIAADSSMTIAYLYKGGIYNRLERFGEALECYEKALHTQEKRRGS